MATQGRVTKRTSSGTALGERSRSRPHAPGYGISRSERGLMPWKNVQRQLEQSRNYWIATVRADGRPHVMPVWGVWVEDALCFGTARDSRKGKNLLRDPRLVVHLESGDDVVILEGTVQEVDDRALLERIAEAYGEKYPGFRPDPEPGSGIFAVRPHTGFSWREKDFPKSATRWHFP